MDDTHTEIERKFLVTADGWRDDVVASSEIEQGYVAVDETVGVRVRRLDDKGFLTVKGSGDGVVRPEFEYEIPLDDVRKMLDTLCLVGKLSKTRYFVEQNGQCWEVDVFDGANEGLVLAEIELDAKHADFARPDWLGDEVTDDIRYLNARLVQHPYTEW